MKNRQAIDFEKKMQLVDDYSRTGQVRSGQVRSGQVRSGQIRSDQRSGAQRDMYSITGKFRVKQSRTDRDHVMRFADRRLFR